MQAPLEISTLAVIYVVHSPPLAQLKVSGNTNWAPWLKTYTIFQENFIASDIGILEQFPRQNPGISMIY